MKNSFTKTHVIVFVGMLVAFMVITFLITHQGIDRGPEQNVRVLQTTIGTITGPLTGAISRGFQSCCLEFSLTIMVYCAPALGLALLLQFVKLPQRRWSHVLRITAWAIGWLVWFLGGIVSFGHALS